MRLLDRFLFYEVAPRQVRYLEALDYSNARGLAREVLDQMDEDFLVGPPLTLHLANPELMAGVWSMTRECLASGREGRPMREVVAAVISRLNTCPYCLDIHTSMLHSFESSDVAESLQRGARYRDTAIQSAADWAAANLQPGAAILEHAPGDPPAIIGTAVCFHYLNRMVNIFLDPFPVSGTGWMKSTMTRLSGRILKSRLSRQNPVPGRFLLAPATAPLPPEFSWAETNPNIAAAFQTFAAAAEAAGEASVAPQVRDCVLKEIGATNALAATAFPADTSKGVQQAIANLKPEHRPAARLALLTAIASWQVDEDVIHDFRKHQPPEAGDRDLINLTSWASFAAVRRIASWLHT